MVNGKVKVEKIVSCKIVLILEIVGVPTIGDNVFIYTGAKVVGLVTIADGVIIRAQLLVNKDVKEENITVAGIPAKRSSNRSSKPYLNYRLFN